MRPPVGEHELPLLTLAELRRIGSFPPRKVELTSANVASYIAITGDDRPEYHDANQPVLPLGLHGVLARLAYLGDHRMPPGGVMLSQTIAFTDHLDPRRPIRLQAWVEQVDTSSRNPFVRLRTTASQDDKPPAATVRIDARWPTDT